MALLLTASYLAYAIAEALELSGTLTLLFAALTLGHYTRRTLAAPAKAGVGLAVHLMAELAGTN